MGFTGLACLFVSFNLRLAVSSAENCADTSFQGHCTHCKPGRFGDNCETRCTGNCDTGGCDKTTGICFLCTDTFHDFYCNKTCPNNCEPPKCDRATGRCYSCKKTWWGDRCDRKCSKNCRQQHCESRTVRELRENCENNECRSNVGFCTLGCIDGATGPQCEKQCSTGCVDGICSQLEGICNTGCRDGFYGSHCNISCLRKTCDHCDQSTGECISISAVCDGYCDDAGIPFMVFRLVIVLIFFMPFALLLFPNGNKVFRYIIRNLLLIFHGKKRKTTDHHEMTPLLEG